MEINKQNLKLAKSLSNMFMLMNDGIATSFSIELIDEVGSKTTFELPERTNKDIAGFIINIMPKKHKVVEYSILSEFDNGSEVTINLSQKKPD